MCKDTFKDLEWYSLGRLSNPDINSPNFDKAGVYLWVYHGSPNRIIYVGTACSDYGFRGRNAQHVGNAYYGLGYAFKLDGTSDPYAYLRSSGKEFMNLIDNGLFYTPEYKSKINPWSQPEIQTFLSKIELWVCPLESSEAHNRNEIAKYLETQIHYVFKKELKIGYGAVNKYHISWLGKMERYCSPDLTNFKFRFNTLPDVDSNTIALLNNLTDYIDDEPLTRKKILKESLLSKTTI